MFVAISHPTNNGNYAAIIDGPGFDSDTDLVDGYEVDACVASFATVEEAEAWLADKIAEHDDDTGISDMVIVPGGRVVTY